MAKSSIEWTDQTWNPVTGCTRVSRGCDLCYAATMSKRLALMGQEKYKGLINDGKDHFNGVIKTHHDALDIPLKRKKPDVFFVNSMSDLFHPNVPFYFIVDVFEVMARAPQHIFQVLTKRPERMAADTPQIYTEVANRLGRRNGYAKMPLPNVWLGTSVEDDAAAQTRIPHLANTNAAVRFLSCEPLLGPTPNLPMSEIHWVIVGGESGHGSRPIDKQWVLDIHTQCQLADVPFFFKQWGGVNKKKTGRELNGRTWDEMPDVRRDLTPSEMKLTSNQLHFLSVRVEKQGDSDQHAHFVEHQKRMAEFGWLWRPDLKHLEGLFDDYGVKRPF